MFTIEDAQNLIPWLKQICVEIKPLNKRSQVLSHQIKTLESKLKGNGTNEAHQSLAEMKKKLTNTTNLINDKLIIVEKKGILIKSIDPGLFDFPHLKDGKEVYLCWHEKEDFLEFWHDINSGFAGRKQI